MISVPIATRLGLGSVLGYLIAGIVLSPVLGVLGVDVEAIQRFAEFGVVMMLFLVGLELEPRLLWEMRRRLLGLGGGQVLLTMAAIAAVAMATGLAWQTGLAVGMVLALSSTAIVLQTLTEKGLLKSDGGQSAFSVLLTQDIAVIPMLAVLPLLAIPEVTAWLGAGDAVLIGAGAGGEGDLSLVDELPGWASALVTLGAIGAVVLGGSYLTAPMFRFIAKAQLRELFVAAALAMVVGIALLMTMVGLSPALGTFLAGVVVANSTYRHELKSDIDPFRGLLLGLFFITVGAGIDFGLLYEELALVLGLTLGLMALKGAILALLTWALGIRGADGWLVTLGLAQAGEFGFVLLSFSTANGVLPPELADRLLLVVALSMLLTPGLFILYDKVIAPRYLDGDGREPDEMDEDAPVIIAGAGRMGGLVNRILRSGGCETTVIDFSAATLDALARFGVKHYYGDATRPDLLAAAGLDRAKLLIVAIDGREQIDTIVKYVCETHPEVHVIARAVDRDHVYDLWSYGCRDIIRETYDGSLRIARSAFEAAGIDHDTAERMVGAFREMDREIMPKMAEAHRVGVAPHENDAYVARVKELREEYEPRVAEEMAAIRDGREAAE